MNKKQFKLLYKNQKDLADHFVAHANAIWNAVFPEEQNDWEYGAQLERCVINEVNHLKEENKRLRKQLSRLKALVCPTCGFPVTEINRNTLFIAAQCAWCNETVHLELPETKIRKNMREL